MIDTPPAPPMDSHRSAADDAKIEARLAKLEANADSTGRMLDVMQQHIDEGIRRHSSELSGLRTELRAEIASIRSEIANLRKDMTEMQTSLARLDARIDALEAKQSDMLREMGSIRTEMSMNFRWLVGIQISVILMVMGFLYRVTG